MGKGSTPLGRPMFDELEIKAHVWCEFRNLHEQAIERMERDILSQLEATNERMRDHLAFMRRYHAAQHVCVVCGQPPAPGRKWCRHCLDAAKANVSAMRMRRAKEGRCVCGHPLEDGYKTCERCRERALASYHKRMGHEHDA